MFDKKDVLEKEIASLEAIIKKYEDEGFSLNENKPDIHYISTRLTKARLHLEEKKEQLKKL